VTLPLNGASQAAGHCNSTVPVNLDRIGQQPNRPCNADRIEASPTVDSRVSRADIFALEPSCENGSSAVRFSLQSHWPRQPERE
jgi:hypothetical protein